MISAQARQSFERVLQRAVQARLVQHAGDACDFARVEPGADDSRNADSDPVVALTISSMGFRFMLFLRFGSDTATANYFARGGMPLHDALLELGNLCCGAINQDLVHHFPDLGMSTPYVLGGQSLRHIDSLHPDYRADYRVNCGANCGTNFAVSPAGTVQVGVTMCVFTRVPVDFHAGQEIEEASSEGELELF